MLIDVKPINSIPFAVDGIIIRLIAGFNRLFCHCFNLDEIQGSGGEVLRTSIRI